MGGTTVRLIHLHASLMPEISGISKRCAGTVSEGMGTGSEWEANAGINPRIKKVEALIMYCNRDSTNT
jgi:hypothetical protein